MHPNVTFLPVGRCVKTIKSTEQSHNNMKNIKSPMATPTYRRRRGKREFWSKTKAFANHDLLNPSASATPARRETKHLARKLPKPRPIENVVLKADISLESLGLSLGQAYRVETQSIV